MGSVDQLSGSIPRSPSRGAAVQRKTLVQELPKTPSNLLPNQQYILLPHFIIPSKTCIFLKDYQAHLIFFNIGLIIFKNQKITGETTLEKCYCITQYITQYDFIYVHLDTRFYICLCMWRKGKMLTNKFKAVVWMKGCQ